MIPPDTTLAKSGNRIIQAVNSAIRLWDANGTLLHGRTLANFFSTYTFPRPPFDPRVIYDRNSPNPRFFVVATQYTEGPPAKSHVHFAVSRSPNPSSLNPADWCHYFIPTTNDFGQSQPTFADQPTIGASADGFIVSKNHYTMLTPAAIFTYATIHAINKLGIEDNTNGCQTGVGKIFRPAATQGDLNTFSLQPMHHYNSPSSFPGTPNPAYLVNTRSGNSDTYWVWRIRDIPGPSAPGQLHVVTAATAYVYSIPPSAPQKNAPGFPLDTLDTRVNFSSANHFLSSGWTAKNASAGTYPAASTLVAGTCPRMESTPTIRVGDYVGAQTDPNFTSFWISGEYAAVYPPPPAGSACTWNTEILPVP